MPSNTTPETSDEEPDSDEEETVTVLVWQGSRYTTYDELLDQEPDEYELPIADTEFGKPFEVRDGERVVLADDIEYHGTFAFDIPDDDRPVTLNVHSNDSYHDPDDWGKPIERGLQYKSGREGEPFQCEIWGRIMLWVDYLGSV